MNAHTHSLARASTVSKCRLLNMATGQIHPCWIATCVCFVCLILFFTSHQQSFSYKGTGLPGLNQYKARIIVLAPGHNTVTPVRLEPVAPRSRVKHSTTAPLHSLATCVHFEPSSLENLILLYANNKVSDLQPVHPHGLIRAFVICSLESIISHS